MDQAKKRRRTAGKGESLSWRASPWRWDNISAPATSLTTCASKMLYNFVPPYNATFVMEKLLAAHTDARQAEYG